jgi:acetolactate synthase-like protein
VYTLVGGHISPILVAAEKLGIRIVDVRHEVRKIFNLKSVRIEFWWSSGIQD